LATSAKRAVALVDTSVAVALVVADHAAHDAVVRVLRGRTLGLAGHAWFETYSVLTRLPPPARRSPAEVAELLARNFPATVRLEGRAQTELAARLAPAGIAGGSVYDALVGTAARQAGLPIHTRDRRALSTYRALEVAVELLA
jgi:predicted nucleic acid-binding protein